MSSSAMPWPAILEPVLHPRHLHPRGLGHGFWWRRLHFLRERVRCDGRVGGAGGAGTTFGDGEERRMAWWWGGREEEDRVMTGLEERILFPPFQSVSTSG